MNARTDAAKEEHILIVEDSLTQAVQLQHLLEQAGYQVAAAKNGKEALAAARAKMPALILSDIVMPEMDGFALCREIKSDPELKQTPVILLTSLTGVDEVIKALKCKADNFMRKPYDADRLLTLVENLLHDREVLATERIHLGMEITLNGERHSITTERRQMLDILLSTFMDAVDLNKELTAREKELAQSNQVLAGLHQISDALNRATREQDVLNGALERVCNLPGVQAGWVSLREGETGFRLAASRNLPPALETPQAFAGDCLCRRKLLAGDLDQVTNILECQRLHEATGDTRGLRYHASIPLWNGSRVIGIMNLAGPQDGLFTEEGKQILYSVGNQIAIALERAALLRQMEKQVEEKTAALTEEILERQRTEESLRASEERYRELFENANDMIYTVDSEGRFTSLNKEGERILGVPRAEVLGKRFRDFMAPEAAPDSAVSFEEVIGEELSAAIEKQLVTEDGRRITLEIRRRPIYRDGTLQGVEGIARDVTDRKVLELQFQQAQKMEAIGRLAGGIAHDFNNHLGVIIGYSDMLAEKLGSGNPLSKRANVIKDTATKAAALTKQLLAFSRRQVFESRIVNLNQVVRDFGKMIRPLIGEDIEFVSTLDPRVGKVRVDSGQIDQVLMNLAVNARDAMPQGGKLIVETKNAELDEAYAQGHIAVKPGPYVMLAVSDTGTGMDKETQARLFEPFFTTKEKGKGTGLGLSMVYGVVKQSRGNIWVYSEPGQGTTFKIYLPRVEAESEGLEESKVSSPLQTGEGTILVAEDEGVLRELTSEFLTDSGYTVLVAGSGAEAIEVATQHSGPIHLLVTDAVMPGMSGRELALRLQNIRLGVKVLYVSGYTDDVVLRNGMLKTDMDFLQKPFTKDQLVSKVRKVLGQG